MAELLSRTSGHRGCAPKGTEYYLGRGTAWWEVSEANWSNIVLDFMP